MRLCGFQGLGGRQRGGELRGMPSRWSRAPPIMFWHHAAACFAPVGTGPLACMHARRTDTPGRPLTAPCVFPACARASICPCARACAYARARVRGPRQKAKELVRSERFRGMRAVRLKETRSAFWRFHTKVRRAGVGGGLRRPIHAHMPMFACMHACTRVGGRVYLDRYLGCAVIRCVGVRVRGPAGGRPHPL